MPSPPLRATAIATWLTASAIPRTKSGDWRSRTLTGRLPADFKSMLQEQLARRGEIVSYEVTDEAGPPHDRTFEVAAMVGGVELSRGSGRSKKDAEQLAAEAAIEALEAGVES